jgi:hypothetical protein
MSEETDHVTRRQVTAAPLPSAADVGVSVDVAALLTIDVDAELRKLATAQLQGPWQIPAELVRRSLAAGASAVEVALKRHYVELRDDGAAPPEGVFEALAGLLDARAPARARHEALIALEEAGELGLLAIVGLELEHLELESGAPGRGRLALSVGAGAPPRLERRPAGASGGTILRLRARGIDGARARAWLADAARFASATVTVDAQPLARGLTAYMASQALVVPLPDGRSLRGHVALPRAPGPARLWLLQHGVVVTHQGLAQAPSFEAALELGALLGPRATPADLRAAISPLLPVLTAAAVELMLALSSRAQGLSLAAQSWLLALLLEAARLGYQRAAIGEAAVIPALLGEDEGGGAPSLISIAALRGRSERDHAGQAVALALDPDQPRRDLLRGGAPLALLDAAARSTITELYGLRFRPPGRRPARARALARGLAWATRGAAQLLELGPLSLLRGLERPLPAEALSREQRALAEHLRAILATGGGSGAPIDVVFCAGSGWPRRRGRRLCLPQDAPEVRAAVRLLAEEGPGWLYPAALALLHGRGEPAAGARATWRRAWSRESASGRR